MIRKFDICLSRKKIKILPRKDLEGQFIEVQEEVFKQAKEIIQKDHEIIQQAEEIIQKDHEIKELKEKLKKTEESQKTQEANRTAHQPSSKQPEWDKDGNPLGKPKREEEE